MATTCLLMGACSEPAKTDPQAGPSQPSRGLADLFKPPEPKTASDSRPSEVGKVICFYRANPFLSFDREGDPEPEGFTFTLFLISRKASKGILESGTLMVKMFRVDRNAGGETKRTLVREWTAETETLVQSHKPHPFFGMGYQPQFAWEKTDDVVGQDVEILAAFTARDGRTIQSQSKPLRVPGKKGT